jgi:phosphoribosylglycinamide formyltransferase 1
MINYKKIVILTGLELRHKFFRKFISSFNEVKVLISYCEEKKIDLRSITDEASDNLFRLKHISAREQSENDFFNLFSQHIKDRSNPVFISKGSINKSKYVNHIINSDPDLIISYGCSIIKEPLLSAFKGRFINIHLGLSPYYRGSGTNFWPLVNSQPELVGVTFMHIDEGIDTGEVIHQIRAKYVFGDTPSTIGNRLIIDMSRTLIKIIANFEELVKMNQMPIPKDEKVYKKADYTEESVIKLYDNFNSGLVEDYLDNKNVKNKKFPIIENNNI